MNYSRSAIDYKEIANKYGVDDLSAASLVGSRLANILERLDSNGVLSIIALQYLLENELLALHDYATGKTTFSEFQEANRPEQNSRKLKFEKQKRREKIERELAEEAKQSAINAARERAAAAKLAFDRDPKNIAKEKQLSLRKKYGLSNFIEKVYFLTLMGIIDRVDAGFRLLDEEVIWLSTDAEEYYTRELREGFHRNEAKFYADEFKNKKDPWSAVNASSHYRKCGESATADLMLRSIDIDSQKELKIKSALCTTHGGVKRDLQKWNEALELGEKAHQFTPQDFRPCTLLGAVNMEIGRYDLGQFWYEKAAARGASLKSIDDELRSIFLRADKTKQDALREHLLNIDPVRYNWLVWVGLKRSHTR